MTLREEIIDLSEDRLDESMALGIIALAGLLGLVSTATAMSIADKIKTKKWKQAKMSETLERKTWEDPNNTIYTGFDVVDGRLKTYLIPTENYLMDFARKKVVAIPAIKQILVLDEYEFNDFLKETKKLLAGSYKELFNKLHLYDEDKKDKVKKFLEKKLEVEFYCRGIVAFTEKQKKEIEKTISEAIKEAGVDKFKFKMRSGTYR